MVWIPSDVDIHSKKRWMSADAACSDVYTAVKLGIINRAVINLFWSPERCWFFCFALYKQRKHKKQTTPDGNACHHAIYGAVGGFMHAAAVGFA